MVVQLKPLILVAAMVVCLAAAGCQSEEAKNSYLDAPMSKDNPNPAQIAKDRGMTPEQAASMTGTPPVPGAGRK